MLRSFVLSSAIALSGTAVIAGNLDDPIIEAAPVAAAPIVLAPETDWTGFYAGVQLVGGGTDFSSSSRGFDGSTDGSIDQNNQNTDGFGIHGGYLRDFGSFIVGGEVDVDQLEVNDASILVTRVKGIAGYDLGRFMPYVTAGFGQVVFDSSELAIDSVDDDISAVYGLGGVYRINDRFRVSGEYLTFDQNDFDASDVDVQLDTFSLRASFNF